MGFLTVSPINDDNRLIVDNFRSELSRQLLVVALALLVVVLAWNAWRVFQFRRAVGHRRDDLLGKMGLATAPEPWGRKILRVGFGALWIFDGLLQTQSAMPVGLGSQVIQPGSSTSPGWVQHLVHSGVLVWNNHPIQSGAAVVWIEVGLGLWLLVAPRGPWSQAGAVVTIGWGLIVWGFGEAFGGVFAPGLTILTGAPGAALFYCIGGGLVAVPERWWARPRMGRSVLASVGVLFVGMGVLQAWPGRGFWQGAVAGHRTGTLVGKLDSLASSQQPNVLSSWASSFRIFDAGHGGAVNLVAVVVLLALGIGLLSGHRRSTAAAVWATCLFCVADWVLVQDFGFLGGLGTDPNSMIPLTLIVVGGYLGMVRDTATSVVPAPAEQFSVPAHVPARHPVGYRMHVLGATFAAAVILLGAIPMAAAATNPTADPIITEANNGAPDEVDTPAPNFTLTDQDGHTVQLSDLRGKALAITFLDPVCTTDCPVIAQEYHLADQALGASAARTVFIAIVANPLYRSTFYTNLFDRQEGLNHLSNWLYLTGSITELDRIWAVYGAEVLLYPAGAMVDHSNISYVIDPRGRIRYIMSADPGDATSTTRSSFTGLLDQQLTSVLPRS